MSAWDAIVIGGGPAGSTVAIQLAQAGCRVLLLEKTACAHHKVCGEFISIEARHYLRMLGLDMDSQGDIVRYVRLTKGPLMVRAALPFQGLSLSRKILDEALLKRAVGKGASVRRGCRVSGLRYENGVWHVSAASEVFTSGSVFLATGKHELRGFHRHCGMQDELIGFKLHFYLERAQVAELKQHSELCLFEGGYAGLEMVEEGKANLCLVIARRRFLALGKSWAALLAYVQQATPLFKARLQAAASCWEQPLAVYRIPYGFFYARTGHEPPGLYRVGDQMMVVPSFCGDGIAVALHTALLAADSYLHANAAEYYRHAEASLRPQLNRASRLSRIIAYPAAQKGLIGLCRLAPSVLGALAERTRIAEPFACDARRESEAV